MKLNIIPFKNDAYDCLHGLIVAVAKYKNWNYKMMFLYRWGFEYYLEKENCNFIGERISCGWFGYWKALKEYHGIGVKWFLHKSDELLSVRIHTELLNDIPIILNLNAYWCPWSQSYNKYFTNHYCLAIGIDVEEKKILCIDPYVSSKIEYLSFEDLINVERCGIVEYHGNNMPQWTLKGVLNRVKNRIYDKPNDRDMFESMLILADELEEKELLRRELISFKNIHVIPIIVEINRIRTNRKAFAETLDYISLEMKCKKLEEISENIKISSSKWNMIRLILIKMAMTKSRDINTDIITQNVRNVATYERDIYNDLCKLIMGL